LGMSFTFCGWEASCDGNKHLKPGQQPHRGHGYTMYHGTHKVNAKAIITNGFQPSRGGTLGAGVYCSRDINKAKVYPSGCSDIDRVVFKLKVRVGKVKKIDQVGYALQITWHQNGYDTAWIPPLNGSLEEDCVWDPKRITIVGISHCTDGKTREELKKLVMEQESSRNKDARHTKGNCQICGKENEESHPFFTCWKCHKTICPFMNKHVCKKK
uniref:PARP catalytic domain-containing protein n=2 Tax=Latimeria chalumnae TaxID=7897 RepID=H3BHX3_LATCH